MFRRNEQSWEPLVNEMIGKFMAAYALLGALSPSTTDAPPPNADLLRVDLQILLVSAQQLRTRAVESAAPPRLLDRTKLHLYADSSTQIWALLHLYYLITPWINGPIDDHRTEARKFANAIEKELQPWLIIVGEFMAYRMSLMETAIPMVQNMSAKTELLLKSVRPTVDSWGDAPKYEE